jgi:hypothetical protein
MSGAPDQVSDDEVPIPPLHVTPLLARAAATLLADSGDAVPIPRFSRRTALLSCDGDATVPLRCPSGFAFPPLPPLLLFALNLAADAVWGTVNTDFFFFPEHPPTCSSDSRCGC